MVEPHAAPISPWQNSVAAANSAARRHERAPRCAEQVPRNVPPVRQHAEEVLQRAEQALQNVRPAEPRRAAQGLRSAAQVPPGAPSPALRLVVAVRPRPGLLPTGKSKAQLPLRGPSHAAA